MRRKKVLIFKAMIKQWKKKKSQRSHRKTLRNSKVFKSFDI